MSFPQNCITRIGKFDAAHRVLHERFKCFNLHGHEYRYELKFRWDCDLGLGYGIDFKEIKRVAGEWIESRMDHGFLANPADSRFIEVCREYGLKVYEMNGVDGFGFCNPSAENIAKEIFFAASVLLGGTDLTLHSVKLWETENCFVECNQLSTDEIERFQNSPLYPDVKGWKVQRGVVEYDERRVGHAGVVA